jgi:hypothetical protein
VTRFADESPIRRIGFNGARWLHNEIDVAVAGHGLVPGLVALALTARAPQLRVAVLSADPAVGGDRLDLVLPALLPAEFAALIAPLVVSEWDDCLLNLPGGSERIDLPVSLLDPVQLWLHLAERIDPAALVANCTGLGHDNGRLHWDGGAVACASLIDLRHLIAPARISEIVGAAALDSLGRPVLADLAARGPYDYLQYIPLGDGRVVINRFERTGETAVRRARFGAAVIGDLPIVRFYRDLGELCAGLANPG